MRFVYVRPLDDYLSLTRPRDVIELPIDSDLDINGWDIAKALPLVKRALQVLSEREVAPQLGLLKSTIRIPFTRKKPK